MKQTYIINKFIYHVLSNGEAVIQTQSGMVRTDNVDMMRLIETWDQKNQTIANLEEFKSAFGADYIDAIEFLESYRIIEEMKEKKLDIDRLSIISNHSEILTLLHKTIQTDYGKYSDVNVYDIDSIKPSQEKELSIVFLNPYNKALGLELRNRQMKSTNSIMLMSYVYESNFYIDCLYSPDWKTPCHQCHMGHIETQSLVADSDTMTYQQMVSSLYAVDQNFKIEIPMTGTQQMNIVTLISNKLNQFMNDYHTSKLHPEEMSDCTLLDLKTMKSYKDTSIHWELCDCYE
ncbi:McbB family protein [Pseudalkalibacillus berkeleyi]|uniref:McbB family protein n=1 Tax=Pseudalkalibacillus berkeleyi TaxID=1069813 RepID=A0ABS9GUJ7_9BACL|nr:McbB family protein [Pseudalkalibacillus berkeleyi]MCF6136513.1 McbB family protein [Pseudalkalibacillus berkeleyi]